ncbi:hypothetical protein VTK26DRAFT_8867 [Humicola hyalothermophila]
MDDLSIQQAVLASLNDLPDSVPTKEDDIRAVKAEIRIIQQKLAKVQGPGSSRATDMEAGSNLGQVGVSDRNRHYSGASSTSIDLTTMTSRSDTSSQHVPGIHPKKRSIETVYLDIDHLPPGGASKSRRTSPGPAPNAFGSRARGFGDFDDFQDVDVIDLTGDDDEAWRTTVRRQKEAEERLRRRKAEADRDADLARELAARASPPATGLGPGESSQMARNNAFDRILGRSSQSLRGPNQSNPIVKREHGSFSRADRDMTRPEFGRYRVPGAYEDSDSEYQESESGSFGSSGSSNQSVARPSRPSLPPFSSLSSATSFPSGLTAPSLPRNPGAQAPGFRPSSALQYNPNIPAIEQARLTSMAQQEGAARTMPPGWSPAGPPGRFQTPARDTGSPFSGYSPIIGQAAPSPSSFHPNRPGFVSNGSYYPQPGYPTSSSLASTINRVNGYDFSAMVDADGNPLSSRLVNFLDDYVNDPRKTEEDIQQLLSNIRPDMEIPEEERGETPEAMKYPLYAHQQLALKWMSNMEEGTNKGGILADDMGLGKTISALALMVSRPSSDNIKTNLIIGPVALIKQWEHEVKKKLRASHRLSVFLMHQKKNVPFSELRRYDVVLTSYGSIASEWKRYHNHVQQRNGSDQYDPAADQELAKKCPLLHSRSKFYRIILDEAQCIKNKETQGAKGVHQINATYRWCLTGTPMMNNVSELYPLVRFLRIRPYCDFRMFQGAFKSLGPRSNGNDYTRNTAMKKLQAVLKATMLRRMKDSLIDGKPILTLPEKTEHSENVVFSEDERQFYKDLESRTQVQFNKFLRAGTIGRNYSNILTLLLRLRQACCHPHLTDFESVGATATDTSMEELAKQMQASVIDRIKSIEAFECPICYDAVADPTLLLPCGHDTCSECFTSLTENSAQNNIRSGNEDGSARCPVCRGPVDPAKVINYTAFRKVHIPEATEAGGSDSKTPEDETDLSDSSDDDTDSGTDSLGSLEDFIVPDEKVDDPGSNEDDELEDELEMAARIKEKEARKAKKIKKGKEVDKMPAKGKGKAKVKGESEEIKPHMLKKLRVEATKHKDARRRYMHYLRDNWEDSAKVTHVINLLEKIQESDEKTIIFSQWTALLDLIECQIKYKLRLRYCRYTGDMSRNQRDEAVQDFTENPRNRVMLVSLRAGNAGLNLTAASRIIICDPFWNPYIEMQAVDRAHRIGQQRPVQVHRILVKDTVEDRILDLQEQKRRLVELALDEGESRNVGRLSERELAYLFGLAPRRD